MVYVSDLDRHATYAVDDATGTLAWSLSATVGTTGPTVIGHTLLFNDFNELRAVRAKTGQPIWTAHLGVSSSSFASRSGQTLYVGSEDNGKLYAIDFRDGTVLWTFQGLGNIEGSIALSDGVAYWGTDLAQGHAHVFAVDVVTHQLLWRDKVGNQVVATPAIANGRVYVPSFDGVLHAFNARTGAEVWTGQAVSGAQPTVANGIVYLCDGTGLVHGYDATTGDDLWTFDPPGAIPALVSVADDTLFDGNDTSVFAMRLAGA